MKTAAHILVSGIVQGVGFRYFVQRRANQTGLTGIVRNLPGGDVEIEVEGEKRLIEDLVAQVATGPRSARVDRVDVTWDVPMKNFMRFDAD